MFHEIPLTALTGTYCKCMDIEPPKFATTCIQPMVDYIKGNATHGKVDRVLMYNPDAVADYIIEEYPEKFAKLKELLKWHQPMLSMIPPKTPVCFGSIYSGATPEQHGITKYEKRLLTIDTIFDALIRAGKKPCIVSVANQSMDILFRERDMDYYSTKDDASAVEKGLELIKEDKYDFICVYNQDHDSFMHLSHPRSKKALGAIDAYNRSIERLCNAVKEYWGDHDTLIGWGTDHGTHRAWYGLGQHGKNIEKDMNITHFYDVYPAKK